MRYFLAPRSGEQSYENYLSTIKYGVPYDRIAPFLSDEGKDILKKEEIIYAWGNREARSASWRRMERGDTVIFYANKSFIMAGDLIYKQKSSEMALAMWPRDEHGNPWEYTFFVNNIRYFNIPLDYFNSISGYRMTAVMGFMEVAEEKVESILHHYTTFDELFRAFQDKQSSEIPLESERVHVNIPESIAPTVRSNVLIEPQPIDTIQTAKPPQKKTDYAARNLRNAITGSKGEEIVIKLEKERLSKAGHEELANRIKRVSLTDDTQGYDILSFELDGSERLIEVKSSTATADGIQFFISNREYQVGRGRKNYYVYYVQGVDGKKPKVTIINDPIDPQKFLIQPDGYVFRGRQKADEA